MSPTPSSTQPSPASPQSGLGGVSPAALHDAAMAIMNEALLCEDKRRQRRLLTLACEVESEAAWLVPRKPENEPSRGLLFLGAASLAMRLEKYGNAYLLARDGLNGFPPAETREKLEELIKTLGF